MNEIEVKEYKYQFSIIVSVFNVEEYIQEALDSLVNQTIGFEENVQVILVNDGSIDSSDEICKAFQTQYPSNVSYYEKENGGLSSARNMGLEHVKGKYVNFFDPDDILPQNVLEEVQAFFDAHYGEIDYVTIPLIYFEGQQGLHGKYKWFGNKNRVINLMGEPQNFILTAAATFYKASSIRDKRFNTQLVTAEDGAFNMELNQGNPCFGYVCESGVKYLYRKRLANTSNVDKIRTGSDVSAWTSIVFMFWDLLNKPKLETFEKEYLVYELRSRLRDLRKAYFRNEEDYNDLLKQYSYWIKKLDTHFILNESKWLDRKEKRALFLKLSNRSYADCMNQGLVNLKKFDVRLKNFSINSAGYIELDCLIYTFDNEQFDVVLLDNDDNVIEPTKSQDLHSSYDIRIGEFTLDRTHYRKFKFPARQGKLRFKFRHMATNKLYTVRRVVPDGRSAFILRDKRIHIVQNGWNIIYGKQAFTLSKCDKKRLRTKLKEIFELRKTYNKIFYERLLSHQNKKYILINDRPAKGGDNGQALFEHIMANEPKATQRITYFALDKNCSDYKAMKSHYHVIPSGGLRHKYLFLNAKYLYSSHNARNIYSPFKDADFKFYLDLINYQFTWLQHGITKDDISNQANKLNTHDDFITTATENEREEFLRPPYFYDENQIILTGFARHDLLCSKTKGIVTLAPTWRSNLSGSVDKNGFHKPKQGFEDSTYYKVFVSLLSNRQLKSLLHKHDYTLQFLLHPAMECYYDLFTHLENERIHLIRQNEASYSRIFAESAIFITDYSSTAFDFAYLRKPLIYYQFDEEEFFSTHYERGYFSYREDGFGPVEVTEAGVLTYLKKLLEANCEMEDQYLKRIDGFFAFNDKNSCKRILNATLSESQYTVSSEQ